MMESSLVQEFSDVLGPSFVLYDSEVLSAAEMTNYPTRQQVPLILRPGSVQELQRCMQIAHRRRVPIYPSSRGCNWGYGSRVPVQDNNILVELSRLDKILDYDEKLAYVSVEAGVTLQQLFDFLREQKSELILSVTGGSTQSSVLANALERGIGTGLYADRFANICGLEAILADGRRLATGFKRWGNHPVGHLYRWGLGPSLDGLFSQSNFGIVTQATQWLMQVPEHFQLFSYHLDDEAKLPQLIERLRELAMSGFVRPTMTLYNDFRILSSVAQYPFARCTPGRSSLGEVVHIAKAATPLGPVIAKWNGEISLRSLNAAHGKMQSELIEKELGPWVDGWKSVEIDKSEILQKLDDHHRGVHAVSSHDLFRHYLLKKYLGIPDNSAIQQAYWRKSRAYAPPLDPDRDRCGMIWICPIVPMTGADVRQALELIHRTIRHHALEPAVSLQCLSERAINVIASITWDREVEGEDEKALRCYAELQQKLRDAAYFSYRSTTLEMQSPQAQDDTYVQVLSELKNTLDPHGILAPGRYKINGTSQF